MNARCVDGAAAEWAVLCGWPFLGKSVRPAGNQARDSDGRGLSAVVRVSPIFRNRELRLTMTIADILMYAIMFITIGVKAVSEAMVASMPNSI